MPPDVITQLALDAAACTACDLCRRRKQSVFGKGPSTASLMVVGEAPGMQENRTGEPFVGPSGKKLRELFNRAGLDFDAAYLTNVLKCFPGRFGFPTKDKPPQKCAPFLRRQLKIVEPMVVVLAGRQALKWGVLNNTGESSEPLGPWVGKLVRRRDLWGETRFATIYHPSYLLRSEDPQTDEEACVDTLRRVRDYLAARAAGEPPPVEKIKDVTALVARPKQRRVQLFGKKKTK